VFVSADAETMDRAVAQRAVDATTRRDVASNTVVLVLPADAPARTLAQLAQPDVRRIAIGKTATVPAGRYAKQALESAGLWVQVEPKTVPADNVRQVLDYVARGEVDAGFVYRTDATAMGGRVRIAATLAGHTSVRYPAAAVVGSAQPALALAFINFLATPAAQATLARFGFGPP
jgi:molybdate transport system substrate-binding protein